MSKVIDLSVPIVHGHGRLGTTVEFETTYTYEDVNWQGSTMTMFCHYGTHVDAPNHFIRDGDSIEQVPLEKLMGAAAVIELRDHGSEAGIAGDTLEDRGRHVEAGDIVILRTGWSDEWWGKDDFWTRGPFLSPAGAEWLVERRASAIVYDFSEEYVVRNPGFRGEDCIVHHTLLGNNIYNIEYVHNLGAIERPRVTILALPLKLVGLDGAPARVVAIEDADLPRQFGVR